MGKLIDADEFVEWLLSDAITDDQREFAVKVRYAADRMPTADAVPVRKGTWKAVTDDGENYKRICTCCGKEAPFDELEGVYLIYPHCPWCGADMRKDGDSNE